MSTLRYSSGTLKSGALAGTERVLIDNGGARDVTCTTSQIAALAGSLENIPVNTAITTAGSGTLTAAGLVGGLITRTGPSGAYTDTFATAAQIIAALPAGATTGNVFLIRIKNATPYTQTLATATGVTLPATVIVPPFSVYKAFGTVGASSTVTVTHIDTDAVSNGAATSVPALTALSTVGAGTITATSFANGYTLRSGSQSNTAFTDTTDTADNIIAACGQLVNKIGAAFAYTYKNGTNATVTISGGTGVTVSGVTAVPANCTAVFIVTYTAASTLTMVGFLITMPAAVSGTFVANGATAVVVADTNITANSTIAFAMKTVGGTPAGAPFLSAVTAGTGFSVKAAAGDTSTYNYLILN